jgi:opacity protein-like surface antigen
MLAAPAAAQDAPRGSLRAFAGVTFMSETSSTFGAGAGFRLTDHVEVLGDLGRLTNILPHDLQRDLDDAARAFGTFFGGPLVIDGKAPGGYGLGAVRIGATTGRRLRLYGEAGAGVAHGKSDIDARVGTVNVSREVVRALRIKESETAPLMVLGGGATVPLTDRLGVDVGYRFMRMFFDDDVRINTASMSAGIRWLW